LVGGPTEKIKLWDKTPHELKSYRPLYDGGDEIELNTPVWFIYLLYDDDEI